MSPGVYSSGRSGSPPEPALCSPRALPTTTTHRSFLTPLLLRCFVFILGKVSFTCITTSHVNMFTPPIGQTSLKSVQLRLHRLKPALDFSRQDGGCSWTQTSALKASLSVTWHVGFKALDWDNHTYWVLSLKSPSCVKLMWTYAVNLHTVLGTYFSLNRSSCEPSPTPTHWLLLKCLAAHTSWIMWCHGLTFRGYPFPQNMCTVAQMAAVIFFSFTALFLLNAPTHTQKTPLSKPQSKQSWLVGVYILYLLTFLLPIYKSSVSQRKNCTKYFWLRKQIFSCLIKFFHAHDRESLQHQ